MNPFIALSFREHHNFHHVDWALVLVHVSAQFDVMPYVILQSLTIDDIPGFAALVGDKRDFVTVRFSPFFTALLISLAPVFCHPGLFPRVFRGGGPESQVLLPTVPTLEWIASSSCGPRNFS
jgi:hypothetical protein